MIQVIVLYRDKETIKTTIVETSLATDEEIMAKVQEEYHVDRVVGVGRVIGGLIFPYGQFVCLTSHTLKGPFGPFFFLLF